MEASIKYNKNIVKEFLISIIVLFALVLLSIQDLNFYKYGELFRTPFSILILNFSIAFIFFFSRKGRFVFSKVEKFFIYYIIYLLNISLINMCFFVYKNEIYLLDKNLIIKGMIFLSYYILLIFAIIFFRLLFQNLSYLNNFFIFSFVNVLLLLVFLIELKTIPYFSFLHESVPYFRVRLLTHEASWAGSLVLVFYFLNLYFYRKSIYNKNYLKLIKFIMFLVTMFFFSFLFLSRSKGLYASLIISMLILFLLLLKRSMTFLRKFKVVKAYIYSMLFVIGLILIFCIIFVPYLAKSISIDIENYTSVSTRIILIYSSVKIFVSNPLGCGVFTFFPKLLKTIDSVLNSLSGNFLLNIQEIITYFHTYKGLAIKTFFFQNLALGGIPFLIIFFLIVRKGYFIVKKEGILLLWLYVTIIISLVFYMNADIKYQYAAFFALISLEVLNEKKKYFNFVP